MAEKAESIPVLQPLSGQPRTKETASVLPTEQARQQTEVLKKSVETKINDCLKPGYQIIENEIRGLTAPPDSHSAQHDFEIFERNITLFELSLKEQLKAEAETALQADPEQTTDPLATRLADSVRARLRKLAETSIPQQKIDLRDFDCSPDKAHFDQYSFYARLAVVLGVKNNHPSLVRKSPETVSDIKTMTKSFLLEWAALASKAKDPNGRLPAGSGESFSLVVKDVLLNSVGVGYLTKAEFDLTWQEVQKDPAVRTLTSTDDKAWRKIDKLLDADDEKPIQKELDKSWEQIKTLAAANKDNKFGFLLRKFGDLGSLGLYLGDKIFLAAIAINVLFSGGDPVKMLKNPVLLALGGASGAIAYKFHPHMFDGKSEKAKSANENLRSDLGKLASSPRPTDRRVVAWLKEVPAAELNRSQWKDVFGIGGARQTISELLTVKKNKGETWVSSAELESILKIANKNFTAPKEVIAAGSSGARLLYEFLWSAKLNNIDPKKELGS